MLLVLGALAFAPTVHAGSPNTIKIGRLSQQIGPGQAAIEARISVRQSEPGREGRQSSPPRARLIAVPVGGTGAKLPAPYPALQADSTLAQNPQPLGPGSFWFPTGPRRVCIYVSDAATPCYTLVGAGGAPARPRLDPAAIAASVADRLPLLAGRIQTSPRAEGLTGAISWFWLDPAPRAEELTVSLAGETVTVRAEPSVVEWRFGDGVDFSGGPGQPYRPGPPPADAVVHEYETRCLPGDQGRNPYVLGSCASTGYEVEAVIVWRISYTASGPVEAAGPLPARTTESSTAYPVSEARGFLVPGGSP